MRGPSVGPGFRIQLLDSLVQGLVLLLQLGDGNLLGTDDFVELADSVLKIHDIGLYLYQSFVVHGASVCCTLLLKKLRFVAEHNYNMVVFLLQ